MRWIAAGAMLCLSAAAQAEELCSKGQASGERLDLSVLVSKNGAAPPQVTYVHVHAAGGDGSYRLSVHYDPTDAGLGIPTRAAIEISMPVPDPEQAAHEQIEWRAGSGPWFNPGDWATPRRIAADPKEIRGSVHYTMAQGRIHPYRAELLGTFGTGIRYEFRRIDPAGRPIGSGSVDYPSSTVIAGLYDRARAQAVANLRPCGGSAPPITAAPAPMPTAPPPAPLDRAALDADACRYFRRQEQLAARHKPEAGQSIRIVGQAVDCDARTVKRLFALEAAPQRDRRALGGRVQALSDRLWCSVPLFRKLMGRGWTFGAELRVPGDANVVAAITRKCPG